MGKNLLIVESPAKAKTIGRYLGKDFRIAASVGHIRDLPSSSIGVDVRRGFKPMYINMRGKEKVIRELKELSSESDTVYIATDPDREGEAIAWHIATILKIDPSSMCRVSFNEITQKAVIEAIRQPRAIDIDLVNAQQTRRILDRLVGYELSPLLWNKIRKGLSAGRVQSVATRMVVDRESEINAFHPEEYWVLTAELTPEHKHFPFKSRYYGRVKGDKTEKIKLSDKEATDKVIAQVSGGSYSVRSVKKGRRKTQPYAPLTTSTLQQEASRRLGFPSRKTMSVAQQLYEGIEVEGYGQVALVSYIRTDSVRVSEDAANEARAIITRKFGPEYLPKSIRKFANKNAAQDAHEAIRPTHFDLTPDVLQDVLSADQYRLYKLIWDRFIASQMASAEIDTVTLDIVCNQQVFRSTGETVVFPGYLAQYIETSDDKPDDDSPESKAKLPLVGEGDLLKLISLSPEQKFTQPPVRYTEATLIKAMEEKGIGRPSTYAPTISTILERNYVEKLNKYLLPTELGTIVTRLLSDHFESVVDTAFTARMEGLLDGIELGKDDWVTVLSDFYGPFHQLIEKASSEVARVEVSAQSTGEKCPECQKGDLMIKEGRFGKFIACSEFPECKYTAAVQTSVNAKCPKCGSGLVSRESRKFKGRIFYTCDKKGSNPECDFISWDLPLDGQFCEVCGQYKVMKKFRGKSYTKCSNKECPGNRSRKKSSAETSGDSEIEAQE